MRSLNKINNKLYAFNNYLLNENNYKYIFAFVCIYATFLLWIPGIPRGLNLTFHLSRIESIKEGIIDEYLGRIFIEIKKRQVIKNIFVTSIATSKSIGRFEGTISGSMF